MPVARSDPRRTTIIGIVGVVVGVLMIVAVLVINASGNKATVGSTSTEFDAGRAKDLAATIDKDRYPLLIQDPANFTRPLWVQHAGDDDSTGWLAFDAAVDGCATTWSADDQQFTDCAGRHYPADGSGLPRYPVSVVKDHVVINLNRDAASTTTTAEPTTTILVTN